ncbi:MAG: large conductance mechanosensitive channel protein MscL [Lachnospiraceae bacterium]|jgi:large conductance mechanosensitive channel
MKKIFGEFKEFISKGNVVDMAVGVVIGAAFRAIVDSVVTDVISPVVGIIFKVDFSALSVVINGSEITYGKFIMAVVKFFIIAIVLFIFVKAVNKFRRLSEKKHPEEAPKTKKCPYCLSEIHVEATKCPHCTSELPEEETEEETEKE